MRSNAKVVIRNLNRERSILEYKLIKAQKRGDVAEITEIEEEIGSVETSVFNCKVEIGY